MAFVVLSGLASTARAQALQVPFSFEHNEIIGHATIDQKGPYTMLLDTDTNPSVVSLALARSSGFTLRRVGGEVSGGGADRPEFCLTKLPHLSLHGSAPKDVQAIAIDLEQMSSRLGTTIDGVLGHNVLSGNVVEIDYPNRQLRLGKHPTPPLPIVASLPFRYDDDSSSIIVDGVTVNGEESLGHHRHGLRRDVQADARGRRDTWPHRGGSQRNTGGIGRVQRNRAEHARSRRGHRHRGDPPARGGRRLFCQGDWPRSEALGTEYRQRLPPRLHRDRGLSA